jgi:uncharacterized protein DUF5661
MPKKCRTGVTLAETRRLAKQLRINWSKVLYGPKDLQRGIKIELEHGKCLGGKRSPETNVTNDSLIKTAKIARAHLKEHFMYYHPQHGLQVWERKLGKLERTKLKKSR